MCERAAAVGGQTLQHYRDMAAALGRDVEIRELRGWSCGPLGGECGPNVDADGNVLAEIGSPALDSMLEVSAAVGPELLEFFEAGPLGGELGHDPLLRLGPDPELECMLDRLKPAHVAIVYRYTYPGD